MIMFFASIITLLIFSFIYNGFLGLDSVNGAAYKISSKMGITNHTFMKAAALGTWMGDFITAWMVTDMMLQVPFLLTFDSIFFIYKPLFSFCGGGQSYECGDVLISQY